MKKIVICLMALVFSLTICLYPLTAKTAYAEEIASDSTITDSTEEKPVEPETTPVVGLNLGKEYLSWYKTTHPEDLQLNSDEIYKLYGSANKLIELRFDEFLSVNYPDDKENILYTIHSYYGGVGTFIYKVVENLENDGIGTPVIPDEDKTITLTPEELKELIDTALTESQKDYANKLSVWFAEKFGVNPDIVYLIIGGGIILILLVVFLIISISKLRIRLKDTQGAYNIQKDSNINLNDILKNITPEKLAETLKNVLPDVVKTASDEIKTTLKIDSDTINTLLNLLYYVDKDNKLIKETLRCLAEHNDKGAIEAVTTNVDKAIIDETLAENAKLKAVVGEEKVKETLKAE